MLPYDLDDDFVGREDLLKDIKAKLEASQDRTLSRVALWGLGGVG